MLIDGGTPVGSFIDVVESYHPLIDVVKFGWGTVLVTDRLAEKIACLVRHHIGFYFGGTLFEKYYHQQQVGAYVQLCRRFGCPMVEISDGTVDLPPREKARFIREFAQEFTVVSEVGFKDPERSLRMHPAHWTRMVTEDLAAGAQKVIAEARESGTSGICRANGQLRDSVLDALLSADLPVDQLIFEAPNKTLQSTFIRRLGPNVNLANVALTDVVGVETLRLGLRADTFFEGQPKLGLSEDRRARPS